MAEVLRIQGRDWDVEQLDFIRSLIAKNPRWSRRRISIELCQELNWRGVDGSLKDMSARLFLGKLNERKLIQLPPRQARGGRHVPHLLRESPPELFDLCGQPEPIEQSLAGLRPLEVILAQARTPQANAFITYLHRHHYLGFGGVTGQNLRYLIRDCQGRDLACMLFGAAAWKIEARDSFIGWNAGVRQTRLGLITNNTRFLILPHVRVPHLASHLLGLIMRRLRKDWFNKYQCAPVLAETFVERDRFAGTCYRAANWLCVGQTRGRGRGDRHNLRAVPVKEIFLYPLCTDFKRRMCYPQ